MSGYHIFHAIREAGLTVLELRRDDLIVRPAKLVTPELFELIRTHKTELVRMLERSSDLPPCQLCQGPLLAVPTFDGFENFECQGCGLCSGCRPIKPIAKDSPPVQQLVQPDLWGAA